MDMKSWHSPGSRTECLIFSIQKPQDSPETGKSLAEMWTEDVMYEKGKDICLDFGKIEKQRKWTLDIGDIL